MPALVTIIGRPNVGKSTLFNRIIGERRAIESPISGTTRDKITALYEGEKTDALFVDTAGIEFSDSTSDLEENVQAQARIAAQEADLILFCVDTKEEYTQKDFAVAEFLRKNIKKTPIFIIGTKADSGMTPDLFSELFSLGIPGAEVFLLSAAHYKGVRELLQAIDSHLFLRGFGKRFLREEKTISPIRLSLLGRPNVGKSSLTNAIIGKEVAVVSSISGTTRDTNMIDFSRDNASFRLIDTAGIRRRSKREEDPIEKYSVLRSLQTIHECDIVLFVVDALEGVTAQDAKILSEINEAFSGIILVVNKWDEQEKGEESQKRFLAHIRRQISFLPWIPVVFLSAKTKKNVDRIFPAANAIFDERKKKIGTGKLNAFLQEIQLLHIPAGMKNTKPRMKYMTQIGVHPPHFVVFGSKLDSLHFSYQRYFENRLRDAFGFEGTGIKIEYRNGAKNPYEQRRSPQKRREE